MAFVKYAMIGAGFGAAYFMLPGSGGKPQSFDQPVSTAVERLQGKHRVVEGTGMGSLTIAGAGWTGNDVLIDVTRAGERKSVRCRVAMAAASETSTTANVDCTQPDSENRPARKLGADALAIVVREHVAATIEDRPYDIDGVADRLMAFIATHGPAIAASMQPPRKP